MLLVERFWTSVTYVFSFLTLSHVDRIANKEQTPLDLPANPVHNDLVSGPVFKPPSAGRDSDFQCDYSAMVDWTPCTTADDRGCWLKNKQTGELLDIHTDYEDPANTPSGVHRTYYLNVTESNKNLDGLDFPEGKYFNNTYPGPWIEACWGDTVTIVVTNYLRHNGTSIHWHGIRQLNTTHMDGVNGVTQCPLAPGSSYNYTWRARQYGSSWYHSHYSVQYADGVAGPLTLHGPTSAPFDAAKLPILMTDWGHNSAFSAQSPARRPFGLEKPSILLNGVGNVTRYKNSVKGHNIPEPYTLTFDAPRRPKVKRYLLRLINTSFASTFVFSIDNHWLQVVSSDFVAITPYYTTNVLIGIGQRYSIIVNTTVHDTDNGPTPTDGNFWIRTWQANCFVFDQSQASPGYERAGFLRYDSSSTTIPTSTGWTVNLDCSDEPYDKLQPIVPWQVGSAANDPSGGIGENLTVQFNLRDGGTRFPWAFASMGGDNFNPLYIDYGDPIFLHLNYSGEWPPLWVVYPESYTESSWVYMVLKGLPGRTFGAHPIHFHGHDFAILQQTPSADFPANLHPKLSNPPRRDVVLLPNNGYVVIAFRPDNPGPWLAHCHIADHASGGLALQIMERQRDAAGLWPDVGRSEAVQQVQDGCNEWNKWWGDCRNWLVPDGEAPGASCRLGGVGFSPDSGV